MIDRVIETFTKPEIELTFMDKIIQCIAIITIVTITLMIIAGIIQFLSFLNGKIIEREMKK